MNDKQSEESDDRGASPETTMEHSFCTISKLTQLNEATGSSVYIPRVVSIGPYHHHEPKLQDMAEHEKLLYVKRFLQRNTRVAVKDCLLLLQRLLPNSRRCYHDDSIANINDEEFIKILFVDGCFIIELFLAACHFGEQEKEEEEDPILSNGLKYSLVMSDLLLAENQLPFFVLDSLYKLTMPAGPPIPLPRLAVNFFASLLPQDYKQVLPSSDSIYHLLHLFHSCVVDLAKISARVSSPTKSTASQRRSKRDEAETQVTVFSLREQQQLPPSTAHLIERGVKLKLSNDRLCHLSLKKGNLKISRVVLTKEFFRLLRNLIAYEQHLHPNVSAPVTAYAVFMSCLVQSGTDLDLLWERGVLDYTMNRKEATSFFEDLYKDTIMIDLNELCSAALGHLSRKIWDHCDNQRRPTVSLDQYGYYPRIIIIFLFCEIMQTFFMALAFSKLR